MKHIKLYEEFISEMSTQYTQGDILIKTDDKVQTISTKRGPQQVKLGDAIKIIKLNSHGFRQRSYTVVLMTDDGNDPTRVFDNELEGWEMKNKN